MSTAEFPHRSDDAALLRLIGAIRAEGTPDALEERQLRLADSVGALAGFKCNTDRARAGLGAFISDLVEKDGPRVALELEIAFSGWHDRGDDGAALIEFGLKAKELPSVLAALSALLWPTGYQADDQDREEAWNGTAESHTQS